MVDSVAFCFSKAKLEKENSVMKGIKEIMVRILVVSKKKKNRSNGLN